MKNDLSEAWCKHNWNCLDKVGGVHNCITFPLESEMLHLITSHHVRQCETMCTRHEFIH